MSERWFIRHYGLRFGPLEVTWESLWDETRGLEVVLFGHGKVLWGFKR